MSELHNKQVQHVLDVALLILKAKELGYELTWGETLRSQKEADQNQHSGAGISHSLHLIGLAVDLNLFKDGVWLTKTEDHKPLGEYWKSLRPGNRWGGDFKDGNHYSVEHEGVK